MQRAGGRCKPTLQRVKYNVRKCVCKNSAITKKSINKRRFAVMSSLQYNNLVNKRVFETPCMTPILDSPLTASFAHIEKVYNLECQKPLRIAHRVTETVLKPNSID